MKARLPIPLLAIAGMIGPLFFIALVIAQGILQPDYSHIAMPISALAARPAGWMQNLNFSLLGTLNAAFTIGLHNAIRATRLGVIGILLLLVSCLGILLAGLFPWINLNGVPTETPQHVVGAVLTFSCASTGLLVLSRRMSADPGWHSLSVYVLGTGIVMVILFILVGFFAVDAGTPFHRWGDSCSGCWLRCGSPARSSRHGDSCASLEKNQWLRAAPPNEIRIRAARLRR
jgi:hypothetical membrane protein